MSEVSPPTPAPEARPSTTPPPSKREIRITAEAVTALAAHGPLAPTIIHQRVDFAASMIDGRTAGELPGAERAAEEIGALWRYLHVRLFGGVRGYGAVPGRTLPILAHASQLLAREAS